LIRGWLGHHLELGHFRGTYDRTNLREELVIIFNRLFDADRVPAAETRFAT
jgi:hypothetical protein